MNYEEKYKEAIESIKRIYNQADSYGKELMEKEFPELRESEDERIRNFLIDFIKVCGWTEKKGQGWPLREECIAWLEKQGKQKPIPKFKVGDIIKGPHNNIFEIKEVLENQYVLHSKNGDELNSITIVDRSSCVVEEPASEDLDFLVISLEETIGTSPHSREVIKEHLQKAAEWGRNHFEDKSEMVSEDLEEAANQHSKQVFHGLLVEDNITAFKAGAEWQKQKMMKDAVEGEYWIGEIHLDTPIIQGYNDGDRIKFIPIKTEQQ